MFYLGSLIKRIHFFEKKKKTFGLHLRYQNFLGELLDRVGCMW